MTDATRPLCALSLPALLANATPFRPLPSPLIPDLQWRPFFRCSTTRLCTLSTLNPSLLCLRTPSRAHASGYFSRHYQTCAHTHTHKPTHRRDSPKEKRKTLYRADDSALRHAPQRKQASNLRTRTSTSTQSRILGRLDEGGAVFLTRTHTHTHTPVSAVQSVYPCPLRHHCEALHRHPSPYLLSTSFFCTGTGGGGGARKKQRQLCILLRTTGEVATDGSEGGAAKKKRAKEEGVFVRACLVGVAARGLSSCECRGKAVPCPPSPPPLATVHWLATPLSLSLFGTATFQPRQASKSHTIFVFFISVC